MKENRTRNLRGIKYVHDYSILCYEVVSKTLKVLSKKFVIL